MMNDYCLKFLYDIIMFLNKEFIQTCIEQLCST